MRKLGLKPVVDEHTQILILGSFPSEESLAKSQYYANPRNQFWPIMGKLAKFDHSAPYSKKVTQLLRNRIGIWDVFESCERKGSLDKNIRNARANNFSGFLTEFASIKEIYFNGGKSEKSFHKEFQNSEFTKRVDFKYLPSTSPAHAKLTFEMKLKAWAILK